MSLRFTTPVLGTLLLLTTAVLAAGDPVLGARAFGQCTACHSIEAGRHLTGPSLANVWGRKAGTTDGFTRYSDALQRSGIVWNEQTLDKWLTNPQAMVPGNNMAFAGVRDAKARSDLVAYLKAASEGKAPAPAPAGRMANGMAGMVGDSGPANLRQVESASQVTSLRHCRDTYIVRTVSGAVHKIWEYNVRLKTDSSDHGPAPGKPAMIASGMRGDRFSIVFSSPAEISQFVKESCE